MDIKMVLVEEDVDSLIEKYRLRRTLNHYIEQNKKLKINNPDIVAKCSLISSHIRDLVDNDFGGDNNISLIFNDYRIEEEK